MIPKMGDEAEKFLIIQFGTCKANFSFDIEFHVEVVFPCGFR